MKKIRDILPHREPFLFVDAVVSIEHGQSIECVKTFSANEPFFRGHFPDYPVVPGVILIETMAQAAGIMFCENKEQEGKIAMLVSIDNFKIKRQVGPGDQILLACKFLKKKMSFYTFSGEIFLNTYDNQRTLAASGNLMLGYVPQPV